jgi:hypothetical protein
MKLSLWFPSLLLLVQGGGGRGATAFVPLSLSPSPAAAAAASARLARNARRRNKNEINQKMASSSTTEEDCGCGPANTTTTMYSGDPSKRARQDIDARQVIRGRTFYRLSGQPVTMDDLLPFLSSPTRITRSNDNVSTSDIAAVVFLRSLG